MEKIDLTLESYFLRDVDSSHSTNSVRIYRQENEESAFSTFARNRERNFSSLISRDIAFDFKPSNSMEIFHHENHAKALLEEFYFYSYMNKLGNPPRDSPYYSYGAFGGFIGVCDCCGCDINILNKYGDTYCLDCYKNDTMKDDIFKIT